MHPIDNFLELLPFKRLREMLINSLSHKRIKQIGWFYMIFFTFHSKESLKSKTFVYKAKDNMHMHHLRNSFLDFRNLYVSSFSTF